MKVYSAKHGFVSPTILAKGVVDLAKARDIHAAVMLHPSRLAVDDFKGKISLPGEFYRRSDIIPISKALNCPVKKRKLWIV